MKFSKIILLPLALICISLPAETLKRKKKILPEPTFNFVSELRKVDSLLNQVDQPKAAQEMLNHIKSKAKTQNQRGYYIRCIQYQYILNDKAKEDNDTANTNWVLINSEIAAGASDIKAFLSIDAANFLKGIYEINRWNSERIADDKNINPNNWSIEKINTSINTYIDDALSFSENIDYNPIYEPLINNFKEYDFKLTVHQVLTRSAIHILNGLEIPYSTDYVMPKVQDALAPYNEFSNRDFKISTDPKNEFKRLNLYQKFLSSINNSSQFDKISTLIYFDLERLNDLRDKYANQEVAYLRALEYLYDIYATNPYSNLVAEALARLYQDSDPVKSLAAIEDAIKRHPGFKNESILLWISKTIKTPSIELQTERLNQPGRKLLARVDYKSLERIYVTAYKIDYMDFLERTAYRYGYGNISAYQYTDSLPSFSQQYKITLPKFNDYKIHSAEMALDSLPAGTYIMVVSSTENISDSTSIAAYGIVSYAPYTIVKNEGNYYLMNASNGLPYANEKFKIYADRYGSKVKTRYTEIYEGRTNARGWMDFSSFEKEKGFSIVYIEVGKHILYDSKYINDYNPVDNPVPVTIKTITDRSIYRPGQTVYFKCIAYNHKEKKTMANQKFEIILADNNETEKGRLSLTSNKFGSASGSFILPKGGFNTGDFFLKADQYGSVSFRVEEYKRPKYSAKFLIPQKAYKLNDEVIITGEAKAFAGYAVQDAKVEYTVSRRLKPRYFDWEYQKSDYNRGSNEASIHTGHTVTDKDGKFSVPFKAVPDENMDLKTNPYFIFNISATITDLNGEVKTCSYSLTMAYTDKQVSISGNENYGLGKPIHLNYSVDNLQDQPLAFTGTIAIEKVIEDNQVMRKRLWEPTDTMTISEKDFKAWFPTYEYPRRKPEKSILLSRSFNNEPKTEFVLLPSELKEAGTYIATISSKDSRGETLTASFQFKVAPQTAGPYHLPKALSIQSINGYSFEPKSIARILVSSGAINARVVLSVKSNRGTILEKEIVLNQASQIIEIPVTAADRGNIQAGVYLVSDYRLYAENLVIVVPYSNKELNLRLSSFRDETEPGAKEKWIVKLKGAAAEKAAMESVAVMYDQSLDAIYDNADWGMRIFDNYYHYLNVSSGFEKSHFNPLNETFYGYENLYKNDFKVPHYNYRGSISVMISRQDNNNGAISQKWELRLSDNIGFKDEDADFINNERNSGETITPQLPVALVRKNFNETAFFYPHLTANSKGEISLEFTMPEALTQWKMRMMAHSTTMQTGYLEQSITTSKKVMVQPNVPRFLRQGDNIGIASKIINNTATAISTKVNFILTDEATGEALKWLTDNNEKTINVPANGSSAASFSLKIPDYTGVVTLAFTATAGTFSDGEQHTLPVLSNRTLITESMPVTIRKAGTQTLEFDHLKNNKSTTLAHEKLSVEMSSNPVWYAIQALPFMMEFPHECAEQVFTRLYANSIAAYLANSNPEIKKVYATWERQAASSKGLQSKLQQNQDLKSTLIEETPWLYDAKNETERMRKLGALFNPEKMKEEQQNSFDKLKQMQFENGAFGWFKGMQANTYITQTIVIGFGKMQKMGVDISTYREMVNKAMVYLDEEAKRDYHYYKKQKDLKNFYPNNLQYLYCKSFFPEIGLRMDDSVVQYFIANAEKTWMNLALLNRAQLAAAIKVLKPSSSVPALIIQSFIENAKQTEEMGMYWAANKGGYYWYDAKVETQAAIIEAFSTNKDNAEKIKEQQIWLLRQKQTQNWGTTRGTADACYALLMHGNFLNNQQRVSVSVNNVIVKPQMTEEGTGYYRENLPKESINSNSANIQVTATTSDFAYGAVYWQYFEQMDKLQNTGAGLSITKRIYKVTNGPAGKVKTEILTQDLKVGDIIEISLSISIDRNLEFVHIKDLRGAGTEPVDVLSEYHWQNGMGYYQSTKDASTNFFIDNMAKGIYQLNYTLKVEQAGSFNSGMATVQCMYAPEYVAHSKGVVLKVGE